MEVILRIHSVDGNREVPFTTNRLTLGRTDMADLVLNDSGLSRVHASLNRDGDRIWVIEEGSTNGTFVNGQPVPYTGSVLHDGDEIDLGQTSVVVAFEQPARAVAIPAGTPYEETPTPAGLPTPVIAAAAGVVIILLAAIAIGLAMRGNSDSGKITAKKYSSPSPNTDRDLPVATTEPTSPASTLPDPMKAPSPVATDSPNLAPATVTKKYLAMTPQEQNDFVAREAQHVGRMIGNREGFTFIPAVINQIKIWVNSYARRLNSPRLGIGCHFPRDDLTSLLERARIHAPLVVKSFNEKGLSPQVGLYLAMIEAEYCPCLSSGTGAKGMFQFVGTTARRYGVPYVTANSRDPASDDRCKVEIMAPIAAQYMKDLIARFGTGQLSVPLAIASYNEGEGGLSTNLTRALNATRTSDNPERSFWQMVANSEKMSDQFQREAIKYVPHFFGAAIVGENPRIFGVDMEPLSSYTQPQGNIASQQKTPE
jgi:hypothetical protein